MSLTVECSCGKVIVVPDRLAVLTGTCNACGAPLALLKVSVHSFEVIDDDPEPVKVKPKAKAKVEVVEDGPKPRKRKKKKKRNRAIESDEDSTEAIVAAQKLVVRRIQATICILVGIVILALTGYYGLTRNTNLLEFTGLGLAAIGNGLFVWIYGDFLVIAEDDE